MELQIATPDPIGILASTKDIVENAQDVIIHKEAIPDLAKKVQAKLDAKGVVFNFELGGTGNLEDDLQLVFIEDCVNFCFWPDKGNPKWQVEWPEGHVVTGGWYGLSACFKRALAKGTPVLDATYLQNLTEEQTRQLFEGVDDIDIPLLKERQTALQEAGSVLNEKFHGHIVHAIREGDFDAIKITELIRDSFSSYKDVVRRDGQTIPFLKRAQICANDINVVLKRYQQSLIRTDQLTAFADYKLPQILRMFGVIEYSQALGEKIDAQELIQQGSKEEIEIRAATIWAVEFIREQIPHYTPAEIDNTLWFLSQTIQEVAKPYHRTRTIYY